jgi:hypothetical protein
VVGGEFAVAGRLAKSRENAADQHVPEYQGNDTVRAKGVGIEIAVSGGFRPNPGSGSFGSW